MPGEGYLPPLVIRVLSDDSDFLTVLARDKAALAAFAKETARAHLGADSEQFQSDLTTVKSELLDFARQVSRAHLGADAAPFWAEIARLRAEVAAMSPLDLKLDTNISTVRSTLDSLAGGLALAGVDRMLSGALSGGGGAGSGSEEGFFAHWFTQHLTGHPALLSALGLGGFAQAAMATIPITTSLATAVFTAAAGFTALGIALAPTVLAIGQGATAIYSAQEAVYTAVPLTQAWMSATSKLGQAWTSVPMALQPAVQAIMNALAAGSPITTQLQRFAVHWTEVIAGMMGKGTFDPLILNTMTALNGIMDKLTGGQGLKHFADTLAKMVGPAINGLFGLAMAFGHVATGLGQMLVGGGQGLKFIDALIMALGDLLHTGLVQGIIRGFVEFDRTLLSVLTDVAKFIGYIANAIQKVPVLNTVMNGLGKALEYAVGGALALGLALKAVDLLLGRLGVAGAAKVGETLAADAAGAVGAAGTYRVGLGAADAAGGAASGGLLSKLIGARLATVMTTFVNSAVGALITSLALPAAGAGALIYGAQNTKAYTGQGSRLQEFIKANGGNLTATQRRTLGWEGYTPAQINSALGMATAFGKVAAAEHITLQAASQLAQNTQTLATATGMTTAQSKAFLVALDRNSEAIGATVPTIGELVRASQQAGVGITNMATGFNKFTPAAKVVVHGVSIAADAVTNGAKTIGQAVNMIIGNFRNQNVQLASWAADAQTLLKRGMNPAAVAELAQQAPQLLGTMVHATNAQLQQMNVQVQEQLDLMVMRGKGGVLAFTNTIIDGLHSSDPTVQAAALALAQRLNINIPAQTNGKDAGNHFVDGILSTARKLGDTAAQLAGLAVTAIHTHVPDFFNDGVDAGNGFAAGLISTATLIGDSAAQIASVAQEAIHIHLAISSPSKVMMQLGAFTGQGFALGILSQMGAVRSSSLQLARTAALGAQVRGWDGGASLPGGGAIIGRAAPTVVQNVVVNVTGGGDAQIAKKIRAEVEKSSADLARALRAL